MVDQHALDAHEGGPKVSTVTGRAWALVGVSVLALGWLVYGIESGAGVVGLDQHVTTFVVMHRSPVLDAMAKAVTFFGNEVTLSFLTIDLVVALCLRGARREAGFVAIAMMGSAALTVIGKHLVMRARPPVSDVVGAVLDRSYSFPSGHTLNSAVFAIALLWVVTPRVSAKVAQVYLVALSSLLAVGVGTSRVYLGFHWVSDVLGAWLVAAIWMTVMCTGLAAALRRPERVPRAHTPAAVTTASVAKPATSPMSRP